jgi:TP901 family phage tail tape measure protein
MANGPTIGSIKGTIVIDYDGKGIIQATDDVDNITKKSQGSAEKLKGLSNGLAVFGGVIAGGFAVATKEAISFEQRISAVKAVSGATADEIKALSDKALQLGKDTQFSAGEAASAIEELVKAGVSVQDVLGGAADATVALAAAGSIDLPQAATIAANAMNQFGLTAKELPTVVDKIAGAANASAIDVGQFGFSLSQVGAVAHLAGQTFSDTATAIALLGNAGIVGSDAGTSLKTFLSNLVPTTKKAKDTFKDLGLAVGASGNAFIDAQGNYKSLGEISGILNTATKNLSESQKQVALETIFGSDAIRAASVLAEQGATGFNKLNDAIGKTTAADVAATRMDNAAGSIEQLKGSVETLGIEVGSKFVPELRKVVDVINGWVNAFGNLDKSTQNTILAIVGVAGGLALLFAGVIRVAVALGRLIEAVRIIASLNAIIKITTGLTKAWTIVQQALNVAFLENPIGLIIIAIIALVVGIVLLWKHCETFRKIVMATWSAIKTAIGAVVDWLVKDAWPWIQKVWDGIVDGAKWLWGWIVKIWGAIVSAITAYVKILIKVWDFIAPAVKAVFGLVVAIIQTAWSIISAIFSVIRTVVIALFELWFKVTDTTMHAILDIFKAVWGFIGPYVIGFINAIWATLQWAWNGIVSLTTTVFNWVKGIIVAVWGFIGPYVITAVLLIHDVIAKTLAIIEAVWTVTWNSIKDFFVGLWNFLVNLVQWAIDKFVIIVDGIKAFVLKIKSFFDQLKAAADGGVGTLIDFIKGIPGKVLDAISGLGAMLFNAGKNILLSLKDGMASAWNSVKQWFTDRLQDLRNLLPFSPAKTGPFSGHGWSFYSGQSIMEDFADGVNRSSGVALSSMIGALSGVSATLNPTTATPAATATASTTNVGGATNIGTVVVQGVWDFTDPVATRNMVGALNTELDNYKKGYQ